MFPNETPSSLSGPVHQFPDQTKGGEGPFSELPSVRKRSGRCTQVTLDDSTFITLLTHTSVDIQHFMIFYHFETLNPINSDLRFLQSVTPLSLNLYSN